MSRNPSRKHLGRAGENFAARFVESRGLEILERNYRTREGEIDIVARDGHIIVFIEVKTRRTDTCGLPIEAIDEKKQEKLKDLAELYLINKDLSDPEVRFDAFTIRFDSEKGKWVAQWIKRAFY
ncbi:MAG: YraN family protein [Candidatus Eremiobacteraeota bacterium]|nr:YraN family protein [Candidatus Eremiobacteraeota bacterium]